MSLGVRYFEDDNIVFVIFVWIESSILYELKGKYKAIVCIIGNWFIVKGFCNGCKIDLVLFFITLLVVAESFLPALEGKLIIELVVFLILLIYFSRLW